MSSPVYELLKRPDELFVVEHAHLQPRFVEDSVRVALAGARALPALDDGDFLFSRQVNFETIHTHDVLAERYGTVGELRAELDAATRAARGTRRSTTGCGIDTRRPRARPDTTSTRARPAVERDRPQRQPQHLRGRRLCARVDDPGVDYDKGMGLADRIHSTGRAVVWSGHREAAELYWERLRRSA